ncbi:Fe-S cluster assembly sulfur transfer protein SufU [Brachybacterium hainanense]|uniref:Fe-S cluster assembly sulfur transfer protein SufU n=1 Tax=Brachybacterium hainanense TaxID=1541174 RepID=A0ABV6RB71_9MICO
MSPGLDALYTEIIFEHDRRPRHAGLREPFDAEVSHRNPTCGDEIRLRVRRRGGRVEDLSYEAVGCAMSRASASMMAELLIGRELAEAEDVVHAFETAMGSRGTDPGDEDVLGDAVALLGASKFPGRVKCVLLAWKAYRAALLEADLLSDEEAEA